MIELIIGLSILGAILYANFAPSQREAIAREAMGEQIKVTRRDRMQRDHGLRL
jgi:hypothetical protein